MIITYHGIACFKIQFGDTVVAFNPISKESKTVSKPPRFGADLVLESLRHPDFNGDAQMAQKGAEPFVARGPGEYEVQGITVRGFSTTSHYGGSEHINTLYSLTLEGMNLVFFGALDETELDQEIKEALDGIDILFVPIGGENVGTLDATNAYKLAVKYEPRLIIPMLYEEKSDALKTFVKEGGNEEKKPEDKLTVKRRDLDGKEGEIVVLKAQ